MSLFDQSLQQLHEQLTNKSLSVNELVQASLQRINETDDQVKSFITLDAERARETATQLDKQLADSAKLGALFGLPAGIKDNIVTEGLLTTCASQILSNYEPVYDATVMTKLKQAQSVTIGKLNMDEFGMGGSSEHSNNHATKNPWNLDCVPGGSSGGAAAAVAARQIYFALGTDTGGSIRQPAAYCGIVGLKPTYGLVSRYGLVTFASSFDQIGPLTNSVEDAAYVLQAIAGHDHRDSTSADVVIPDYLSALTDNIQGLKIGVPKELFGQQIDENVKQAVRAALAELEKLGAVWEEVSLPHIEYAVTAFHILASAEASSSLARFDGIRYGVRANEIGDLNDLYVKTRSEGFGEEVKRRILLGTYSLCAGNYDEYYVKAQQIRTLIKQDFTEAFNNYDLLITPTTPTTAFKAGSQVHDPMKMYMNDICTLPANLAGLPAISVPCGLADGLPIGLQLIGKPFDEATMLRAAYAFEQQTEHHQQRPEMVSTRS